MTHTTTNTTLRAMTTPIPAPIPREGGLTIAPPTRRSPRREGYQRVASTVFNMRLTEGQVADLKRLRDKTGVTLQAHVRRAVTDYLYQLKRENPSLFED